MRIRILQLFIVLALVADGAVFLRGQSLAEVAQREEARRKASGSSSKTYTNSDLAPVPAPVAAANPALTEAGPATLDPAASIVDPANPVDVSPAQTKPDELAADEIKSGDGGEAAEARGQEYWRKRMSDIRDQLDRDTSYAVAMQTRVDVLTLDFANRADVGERMRIGVDRQKALADLERLTRAVEDGKKAMADLEEEAQQAGALPGWLR